MRKIILLYIVALTIVSCSEKTKTAVTKEKIIKKTQNIMNKKIDNSLPTIGILIFEGVIINE